MRTFIIRVELHDATYQDYMKLHTCMGQEGFTNVIRGGDGAVYQLPPAEYRLAANCTAAQARDKATVAAQKVFTKYSVIAFEYMSAAWFGLVKPQARVA